MSNQRITRNPAHTIEVTNRDPSPASPYSQFVQSKSFGDSGEPVRKASRRTLASDLGRLVRAVEAWPTPAKIGIVAAGAVAAAAIPRHAWHSSAPERPTVVTRDVSYLDQAGQKQAKPIPFGGMDPELLAQSMNTIPLTGQALVDEGLYIARQGSVTEPNGVHELGEGDTPSVPILTHDQQALINSMNLTDPAAVPNFALNQGR